jgi:signal transduction histidine kinase
MVVSVRKWGPAVDDRDDDSIIVLVDDTPERPEAADRLSKVAVIDDDEAVHEGTRFALRGYALNGQGLEILSAYSATEARELVARHPDIAVILLDVVMETDQAGLELVQFIRRELGNDTVRIILRTGQPGQAPEREVVVNYDINDYKAKTELTADKLFTAITAALRSYDQLRRMKRNREVLESLLAFTKVLLEQRSVHQLAAQVLAWVTDFVHAAEGTVIMLADEDAGPDRVLTATGAWSLAPPLDPARLRQSWAAADDAGVLAEADRIVVPLRTSNGRRTAILLGRPERTEVDPVLIELFKERVAAAFDNAMLQDMLRGANETLELRVAQRTSELLGANRRLEAQWALARRSAAFQHEVLGIVAHDLKNPLSVVLGRSEMLRDLLQEAQSSGLPSTAARAALDQVERIRESARGLTGMVDRLISGAMADAHEIPVHPELVDACIPVREAVEANRALAESKQQHLTLHAEGPLLVRADHERLRDALDNLVSNAVKYTPVGGSITVSVEPEGDEVVLAVRDTGLGLAPEDFPRLFGRFARLSAQPTAGESSTGLGLFIAKRIVDLHGGQIHVESPGPGEGSTFVIRLKRVASGSELAA